MGTSYHRQIVIFGAGIAGLWTLRRLVAAGYDAVLLEREAIGAGQTLAAQGILHGGIKYGLDGSSREIAEKLRSLPPRWLAALDGRESPSLAGSVVLSPVQHLWAADSWMARVGATVGVRAMQGEVRKLEKRDWPVALRAGVRKGTVYELAETVVEVRSVLAALAEPVRDRIFQGAIEDFELRKEGTAPACSRQEGEGTSQPLEAVRAGGIRLTAEQFVFTAATGNEAAAEAVGWGRGITQRRPLKQVLLRGALPPLYGHCVTAAPKPVVTITTHPAGDGKSVWYLGGQVAETATGLDDAEAVAHALQVLGNIFPGMDFSGLEAACWAGDRAEPHTNRHLPDGPAVLEKGPSLIAWPAKLVYAPLLADQLLEKIRERLPPMAAAGQHRPDPHSHASLTESAAGPLPLPRAELGRYPWEQAHWRPAV